MRRREQKRDEDETRRRFDAVWPAAAPQDPRQVGAWGRYDTVAAPPAGPAQPAAPDGAYPVRPAAPEGNPRRGGRRGSGVAAGVTWPESVPGWPESYVDDGRPGADGLAANGLSANGLGVDDLGLGGPDRDGGGGSPAASGRRVLGAFDPGRRGVRALIVVAVLAVAVAAFLAWRAQPRVEPVGPAPSVAGPVEVTPSAESSTIVVAVQGKVAHPGLVHLPAGARVADAIAAAGGALPGVDLSYVNLARRLTDGELIVIGETPPPGVDAAGGADPTAGGKVDLNTASLTELETLPGIGPALAQRIVDYRTQHGAFRSVDDLRQVSGIGDAKFGAVKDLVTV